MTAPRDNAPMMVTPGLTLLAAAAARGFSLEPGNTQVQLGVTATVVRPAEIIAFPTRMDGAVALIHNSAAIEVVADGGIVRQLGGQTTAVTSDRSDSVTITLVF